MGIVCLNDSWTLGHSSLVLYGKLGVRDFCCRLVVRSADVSWARHLGRWTVLFILPQCSLPKKMCRTRVSLSELRLLLMAKMPGILQIAMQVIQYLCVNNTRKSSQYVCILAPRCVMCAVYCYDMAETFTVFRCEKTSLQLGHPFNHKFTCARPGGGLFF